MGVSKRRNDLLLKAKESIVSLVDIAEEFRETKQTLALTSMLDNMSLPSEDLSTVSEDFSGDSSSQFLHKKNVSFGALDIREYSVTIGDHPCCTSGFPLTLDWEYEDAGTIPIDTYEENRCPRRGRAQLKITPEQRCEILAEDGHSDDDMRRAQRKLHRARSCSAKLCERVNASFFQEQQS